AFTGLASRVRRASRMPPASLRPSSGQLPRLPLSRMCPGLLSFEVRLEIRVEQHAGKEPAEAGGRCEAGQAAGRVRGPYGGELAGEVGGADREDPPAMDGPGFVVALVDRHV